MHYKEITGYATKRHHIYAAHVKGSGTQTLEDKNHGTVIRKVDGPASHNI